MCVCVCVCVYVCVYNIYIFITKNDRYRKRDIRLICWSD